MSARKERTQILVLGLTATVIFAAALMGGLVLQDYFSPILPRTRVTLLPNEGPFSFNGTNPVITVQPHTLVEILLVNTGLVEHDFVIDDFAVHLYPDVEPSHQGSVTFYANRSGTYTYYCSVPGHRELGMEGKLVILG